ncbi:MAG: hypothetical protein R3D05_06275 [Dongiaceae bacterium]
MNAFLLTGIVLGAAIGLTHAIQIFRERIASGHRGLPSAAWFAVWTGLLWTVFGPYVLAVWLLGALGLAVSRLRQASGSAR